MRAIRVTHPACHAVELAHDYPLVTIVSTYGETVRELLADGPLILIEHDVDPSPEVMGQVWQERGDAVLAVCYWLYPVTTGLAHRVCAHRPKLGEWLSAEGVQPIEYFGLGCTYLPDEVRDVIAADWDYPALDYLISKAWLERGGRAFAVPQWAEHHHR